MKVSGSILAVKSDYLDYARMLQHTNVDYLHIDIFQDSGMFQLQDILSFDETYLPLDVHLIFRSVTDRDIDMLNKANVKFLNVQYETLEKKAEISALSQKFQGRFGIAVTADTPLSVVDENISSVSQILFMCSEPGVSGAAFDERNFRRIRQLHDKYPSLELFADGGINNLVGEKMGKLGVSMIVSGSYLCRDMEALGTKAYSLKYLNEKNISVTRNMQKLSDLPVLDQNASFTEVINVMNHYRMGMVFIAEDGELKGIIADGDVRRGFLAFGKDIFEKTAQEFMNRSPVTVDSGKSMEEVFSLLSGIHRGIDVVPVLDGRSLIGAVDLHMGI